MPLVKYKDLSPKIAKNVFIADNAWLTGAVEVAEDVTILFGCAIRGDILKIVVGPRSNVQDNSVLHTSRGRIPLIIGEDVTVGHGAILHGCTIQPRVIVGMGSIILDEATIPNDCIIGAGSLVTEGKSFKAGSLIIGRPAKVVRELNSQEIQSILDSARAYQKVGAEYRNYII
jgi:carbonic anhydrase/acetyltransferase-like protein (isoleucine patch superfamily)